MGNGGSSYPVDGYHHLIEVRANTSILSYNLDTLKGYVHGVNMKKRNNAMDFESAVRTLNNLLIEKRPATFNSSWVQKCAPNIYRFIQKNIRTETGVIDWDRITRALDPGFPRQWTAPSRKGKKPYRSKAEVRVVVRKYHDKLYTFLTPTDKNDRYIRDVISISLVRIAQRGNITAKQEIIKLLSLTIDDWIENCPKMSCWRGYDRLIQGRIEGCIRRYRYSGSFIGYLFKTLEYEGRGLRPIIAYSLDDPICSGDKRRIDRIGQDPETGELLSFDRKYWCSVTGR